jgi:hypothetical protein
LASMRRAVILFTSMRAFLTRLAACAERFHSRILSFFVITCGNDMGGLCLGGRNWHLKGQI